MAQHRRQLRNLLLNRRYQLKFTLVMVVLTTILTAGLGSFWYAEMRQTSRILEVKALATIDETEAKRFDSALQRSDRQRLALLIGFGLLLALTITAYGIAITHQVAGPIHKVQGHLRDIRDGQLHELRTLRKGDQLHEFWADFKAMHEQLRSNAEQEQQILTTAIDAIDKAIHTGGTTETTLAQASKELHDLRTRKLRSLGP